MEIFKAFHKYLTNAGLSVRSARLWLRQRKLRELLASEELRAVEQAVADRLSLPLLPCVPLVGETIEKWLGFAGISHEEARKWFVSDRDRLIDFCVATVREFENDDPDGEFPEGEELDEADKSQVVEVLGYGQGGALTALCWYVILKQQSPAAIDLFLENTRMPHCKQFAKRLKAIYDTVMYSD